MNLFKDQKVKGQGHHRPINADTHNVPYAGRGHYDFLKISFLIIKKKS